jgi:CHAT domain-containing protein
VIVANGALQTIPFAALPDPDPAARGELLGGRHEIVYLPSASVLAELRRHGSRPLPPGPIAVLADPVVSRDDPRLPAAARGAAEDELRRLADADAEAEAILALPWRHRGLRRLGFDADRDLVMSGKLRAFPLLHIAAHGLVRLDHPELSSLVLSRFDRAGRPRDGYLRLRDLAALDLHAELVVLSACRTALGREVAGEGLLGLGQGFLAAGARRVLVSLWDVDDPATAALMAHFYRALQTLPPGAALQAAQAAVRADPAWQEPYYWAGFVLQGDWR